MMSNPMNTTPKCPGCGQAMEMLTVPRYICNNCGWLSPYRKTWDRAEEAALQRYVEPNRVLTLDELRAQEMPCALWIEWKKRAFRILPDYLTLEVIVDVGTSVVHFQRDGAWADGCGYTWRAWLRRPTDEERQTVAWEESE